MHIGLHEFLESPSQLCVRRYDTDPSHEKLKTHLHEIHLLERVETRGLDDVDDADDVLADAGLGEELEQLELAQGAQTEHGVVERRDLLDRDLFVRFVSYRGVVLWTELAR